MSKPEKTESRTTQEEAFEIIEMAANDIETLARAFQTIDAAVDALTPRPPRVEESESEYIVH